VAPVAEPPLVGLVVQPLHDRVLRIDLEDRLRPGHLLTGCLEHALEMGTHTVLVADQA
jgi:hypothetical protein